MDAMTAGEADMATTPAPGPTRRRRRLRGAGGALLGLGAAAVLAGVALLLLEPPLPWLADDAPALPGHVLRDIPPEDSVDGPMLLVAVREGADPGDVVAEAAQGAVRVGDLLPDGLLPVVFADEAGAAAAAEALAAHPDVRLVGRPTDPEPGGQP